MAISKLQLDLMHIKKILVVQLCPIGDTLFGTPAIKALRCQFPDAWIASLVWPVSSEVIKENPNLNEIYIYNGSLRKLIGKLRKQQLDLVVELSNRGGWITPLLGAKYNVGFRNRAFKWLYTSSGSIQRDVHAVDYCLDVVKPLGAILDNPGMEIFINNDDDEKAKNILASYGVRQDDLMVTMHPGGKYFPAKRWNTQGFAEVADRLYERYGALVVTVGGTEDDELGKRIESSVTKAKIINLVGKISIKQTAAVIRRSSLFIGNDSSPMHMAVAVKTPVVALFGPTNPSNSRPYGEGHEYIFKYVECSPCFHHLGSPTQYCPKCIRRECMEAITAEDVFNSAIAQLEKHGRRELVVPKN